MEQGTVPSQSDAGWAQFAQLQQVVSDWDDVAWLKTRERFYGGGTLVTLTQMSYDADRRPSCTATRVALASLPDVCAQGPADNGGYDRVTQTIYDTAGRAYVQRENGVNVATYGFDDGTSGAPGNGQLASVTDANGNTTTYGYDPFGRRRSTTYPGPGGTESVAYDPAGNVVTETRRSCAIVANAYDALNRLTSRTPTEANTASTSYAYDQLDRLTAAASAGTAAGWTQTVSFEWDAIGRLMLQTVAQPGLPDRKLSMDYDPAGRRTYLKWGMSGADWGGGAYVGYEYLVTGELRTIRENGIATGPLLASYGYDDLGRRRSLVRGNGVTTAYTPDAGSRLAVQVDELAGTARDQRLDLTYNGVSQLRTRTAANAAYAYPGYWPSVQTVVPDALNRIATLNGAAPGYDANGNLTSDTRGNGYGYNLDNPLVAKTGVASLAYDPLGRLSAIAGAGAGGTVRFDHDPLGGPDLVAESDAAGALLRRHVHGPGVDEPLVTYEGPTKRWYTADERGSVTSLSDDAGTAVAVNAYDEWGVPAAGNAGRFGYTGQAWLGEVGLSYYKARMYDPVLGRFLQTDPIRYDGGMNLYAYVQGDPVNRKDPFGFFDLCISYIKNPTFIEDNKEANLIEFVRGNCLSFDPPSFTGRGAAGGGIGGGGGTGGDGRGAPGSVPPGPPQNGKRGLTPREKRILMCNGASQAAVDTFSLSSGLPAGFGLNPRVDAVTLSPISGISVAHMRNGIGEMTSSRGQYGLIAHEFGHHIQYRQGMTLSSYLSDTWKNGYQDSM